MDGKILFPERDDLVSQPLLLAAGPNLLSRREKKLSPWLIAKLMDKDPKTHLARIRSGRPPVEDDEDTLDEKRPEGLVLAMSRVGRFEEPPN